MSNKKRSFASNQIRNEVWYQLNTIAIGQTLYNQVMDQVTSQVKNQVSDQVIEQAMDLVYDQVKNRVIDQTLFDQALGNNNNRLKQQKRPTGEGWPMLF